MTLTLDIDLFEIGLTVEYYFEHTTGDEIAYPVIEGVYHKGTDLYELLSTGIIEKLQDEIYEHYAELGYDYDSE